MKGPPWLGEEKWLEAKEQQQQEEEEGGNKGGGRNSRVKEEDLWVVLVTGTKKRSMNQRLQLKFNKDV